MRGLDGCGSRCYLPVDYQSFVSSMKVKQRKQIGLKRWLESRNAETRSTLSHHHHRQQRPRPKKEPWWKWRQINDSHTVRRFVCFRWPSSYVLFDGSFLQSKHRFYRFPISSCRVDNLPPAAFSNHIMQKKMMFAYSKNFFLDVIIFEIHFSDHLLALLNSIVTLRWIDFLAASVISCQRNIV